MPDSTSKTSASPSVVASCAADYETERERLIDDLAFLVVRQQHHNQRSAMTSAPGEKSPMLNSNENAARRNEGVT